MIDAAQLAVVIGVANGIVLLLKPIARVHLRIDRNEQNILHHQAELLRLNARLDKLESD